MHSSVYLIKQSYASLPISARFCIPTMIGSETIYEKVSLAIKDASYFYGVNRCNVIISEHPACTSYVNS